MHFVLVSIVAPTVWELIGVIVGAVSCGLTGYALWREAGKVRASRRPVCDQDDLAARRQKLEEVCTRLDENRREVVKTSYQLGVTVEQLKLLKRRFAEADWGGAD